MRLHKVVLLISIMMATCNLSGCVQDKSPEVGGLNRSLNSNQHEEFDRVATRSDSGKARPLLACWWLMSEQLRFLIMDDGTVVFRSRQDDQASPLMRRRLSRNDLREFRTNLDGMSVADLPSYEVLHIHTEANQMKMLVAHKSMEFILSFDGFRAGGKHLRLVNQWAQLDELAAGTQVGDAKLCSKEVQIPAELLNAEPGPSADTSIPWKTIE
jgi:hypothetical protein